MNNDIFTIRPLDFRQVGENQWQAKTSDGNLYAVELMHGVWRWSASFRPYRPMPWTSAPTKEAAMGACEQHWQREIEPALVRVEDAPSMPKISRERCLRLAALEGDSEFGAASPEMVSIMKRNTEDGRDALLGRALEALRHSEKTLCGQEDALRSLGADEPCAENAILGSRRIINEIEKALPAATPEPQTT